MKQSVKERFNSDVPRLLRDHQRMLSDKLRNDLLFKAIKQHVSGETRFLDIGAGTGVWAILAALLGAKRVVAVELEECLIPIIHQFALENGVADKVEIIHADSDDLRLPEKFDVIVSELFGADVYGEKTINSFISLRERFLAENGILIPLKMEKYAVPVRIKNAVDKTGSGLPIKSNFFKSLRLNFYQNMSDPGRDEIEFLASPKKLLEVDFTKIRKPPNLKNLSQNWDLEDLSKANAFALYNHSFYTAALKLDSFDSRSWAVGIYEFKPFTNRKPGEIKFTITLKKEQFHWKISFPAEPEAKVQSYSPGFGVTRVMMARESTPHRKIP